MVENFNTSSLIILYSTLVVIYYYVYHAGIYMVSEKKRMLNSIRNKIKISINDLNAKYNTDIKYHYITNYCKEYDVAFYFEKYKTDMYITIKSTDTISIILNKIEQRALIDNYFKISLKIHKINLITSINSKD